MFGAGFVSSQPVRKQLPDSAVFNMGVAAVESFPSEPRSRSASRPNPGSSVKTRERRLQINRGAWGRNDDFAAGKIGGEGLAEPLRGARIAVNEHHLFWRYLVHVAPEIFAGGMATEVKTFDPATQDLRRQIRAELHQVTLLCGEDLAGR